MSESITLFKRDENGLLPGGNNYPRRPDGRIDWRKLIPLEHLYPNSDYEAELKARFNKTLRKMGSEEYAQMSEHEQDRQLLVNLEGWRHLLRLRGFRSVRFTIAAASSNRVSTVCEIEFVGNFETDMKPVTCSSTAGASFHCVSGKMQLYLETMAENRAFSRCLKNFFNLAIYGKDEFDPLMNAAYEEMLKKAGKPVPETPDPVAEPAASEDSPSATPPIHRWQVLANRCAELGFTLAQIKFSAAKVRKEMVDNPESAKTDRINGDPEKWLTFENIEPLDCMTILAKINLAAATNATTKKTGKRP